MRRLTIKRVTRPDVDTFTDQGFAGSGLWWITGPVLAIRVCADPTRIRHIPLTAIEWYEETWERA